jgi:plastocyanin
MLANCVAGRRGRRRYLGRHVLAAGVLITACLSSACGGPNDEAPKPAAPVTNPVDAATAGRIGGKVTLIGTPPAARTIDAQKSDPDCPGKVTSDDVVVGADGALGNVFVYVKDGLGNLVFPVPTTPVVLGQEHCMYKPHVVGIQVGQTLDIVNGDDTLHNIHAVPTANGEFNKAQQFKGFRNQHVFSTKEVMVPFKCDVHRWMSAYVGVVDHPFFAVTGDGGTFSLEGLPPGTYTIEAVHEKFGRQTQSVTLESKGTQDIAFTFKT